MAANSCQFNTCEAPTKTKFASRWSIICMMRIAESNEKLEQFSFSLSLSLSLELFINGAATCVGDEFLNDGALEGPRVHITKVDVKAKEKQRRKK